jgi:hypothetical protein
MLNISLQSLNKASSLLSALRASDRSFVISDAVSQSLEKL